MEKKRKLDRVSSSSSEVSAEPVPKPSESVKVALLIRPLLADERAAGQNVCLRKVEGKPEVALDGAGGFKFDHVSGPDEPVDVVFERCVLNSILANVLQGFNGTVLAYGQTRSGKTHAMGSGALRGAPSGLIQLAVAALFERLPEGTTVHASFTQIYCEEVHDLLNCSKDGDLATLPIKGSTATGYSLPTAERVLVSSLEDVMAAIARGAANRATGATKMNAHSSRSHAIVSLELAIPDPTPGAAEGATLRPKLLFVDLAGSERTKRAGTSGQSLREGIQINLSLLCLGDVVQALSKGQDFVPYNRSSLTKILQDSLGGNSQTVMLACASPADIDAVETLSTLHAVRAARMITNKPKAVHAAAPTLTKEEQDARVREALERECTAAKQELELVKEELDERGAEIARAACAAVAERACLTVTLAAARAQIAAQQAEIARLRDEGDAQRERAEAAEHEAETAQTSVRLLTKAHERYLAEHQDSEMMAAAAAIAAAAAATKKAAAEAQEAKEAAAAGTPRSAKKRRAAPEPAPAPEEAAAAPAAAAAAAAAGGRRPSKAARQGSKARSVGFAPPTGFANPEAPLDERDYDAKKLAQGVQISSSFVSVIDRFAGPGSIYVKPTSMQAAEAPPPAAVRRPSGRTSKAAAGSVAAARGASKAAEAAAPPPPPPPPPPVEEEEEEEVAMEEEVGKFHPSAHTPSQEKKEKPLVVIDAAIAAATEVIAAAATTEEAAAGALAAPSPRQALGNVANLERSREAPSPSPAKKAPPAGLVTPQRRSRRLAAA